MILDAGICTVFRKVDSSGAGEKPAPSYTRLCQSWYGELAFETAPVSSTASREDVRTDTRIRVHQNRAINNHDVVVLCDVDTVPLGGVPVYEVARAFHGTDDEAGELISDLSLEVTEP